MLRVCHAIARIPLHRFLTLDRTDIGMIYMWPPRDNGDRHADARTARVLVSSMDMAGE